VNRRAIPIRGWLLVFCVAMVLFMVYLVRDILSLVSLVNAPDSLGSPLASGISLLDMIGLVLISFGLFLIFRRRTGARRYWIGILLFAILGAILQLMLYQILVDFMIADDVGLAKVRAIITVRYTAVLLLSAIWAGYWIRSKRVRRTFGIE